MSRSAKGNILGTRGNELDNAHIDCGGGIGHNVVVLLFNSVRQQNGSEYLVKDLRRQKCGQQVLWH